MVECSWLTTRTEGRLVRLIPTSSSSSNDDGSKPALAVSPVTNERAALRALFEHRLCASDSNQARMEWLDLVEARHLLWTFVPSATRELIRAVLNTLNLEIVKRARPSTSVFNFAAASVGNLFLTGARLFSGSFEAAIYLLSLLCGIPDHVAVLPAINSNFTHHISAGLVDGATIAGQVNISHPSAPTSLPDGGQTPQPPAQPQASADAGTGAGAIGLGPTGAVSAVSSIIRRETRLATRQRASTAVDFEDATLPGSLPALRRPQIAFSKDDEEDLPARISRIWYINPYGHEIRPQANPKALGALRQAGTVIYSIGSLYTSIIPSLVLRGVGAAIAGEDEGTDTGRNRGCRRRKKILILNSKIDRETGPHSDPMTAADFVRAIVGACKQSRSDFGAVDDAECKLYVTHLIYLDTAASASAAGTDDSWLSPRVDESELSRLGLQCVAVPSQAPSGAGSRGAGPGMGISKKEKGRYDQAALTQALAQVLDSTWDEVEGLTAGAN